LVFMSTRVSFILVTALAIAATSTRTELVAAETAFSRIFARRSSRSPGPNAAASGSTVLLLAQFCPGGLRLGLTPNMGLQFGFEALSEATSANKTCRS